MDKLYRCEQVAERYGVQIKTIWKWIRAKELPTVRVGRSYLIRESDLESFENSHYTAAAEPLKEQE